MHDSDAHKGENPGTPVPGRAPFSLVDGGPFYGFLVRLRLARAGGRINGWALGLVAWLPLALAGGLRVLWGLGLDPALRDISVHVRLLVALPMILFSFRLLDAGCRSALRSLYTGQFCELGFLDRIVERGKALRDARWPELLLALLAMTGSQLVLWQVFGSTGWIHGGSSRLPWSFGRVWYLVVSLPLMQFVMFWWLWRWMIWSAMLIQMARLPLSILATHPDKAAGLSLLGRPLSSFAGFVFALGALQSSAWEAQVLSGLTTVQDKVPDLLILVLAVLAVGVAPLLPFCGHLYKVRRSGLAQYGDFADRYIRSFHAKWIEDKDAGSALGSSDIQSLADLGNSFSVISNTRIFVFGLRSVLAVCTAVVLPMAPLLLNMMSVEEVLKRLINALLGGIPI